MGAEAKALDTPPAESFSPANVLRVLRNSATAQRAVIDSQRAYRRTLALKNEASVAIVRHKEDAAVGLRIALNIIGGPTVESKRRRLTSKRELFHDGVAVTEESIALLDMAIAQHEAALNPLLHDIEVLAGIVAELEEAQSAAPQEKNQHAA